MTTRIVVIGGGPGGYAAAIRAAQLGADVTLVEKEQLGGTCLNRGCIPSKMLRKAADMMAMTKKFASYGIVSNSNDITFNMQIHVEQQTKLLTSQIKGIAALLKNNDVQVIYGKATLSPGKTVTVSKDDDTEIRLEYDKLILAIGSSPLSIPAFPFNNTNILSSTDILQLDRVPESLAIVGGGVIGCEFGSIFAALGTKVTIIEGLDRLIPLDSLSKGISKNLTRELKKQKISIITGHTVSSAAQNGEKLIINIAKMDSPDSTREITAEKMLVSIGRNSNGDQLRLQDYGVKCDSRGWITTDAHLATSNPDIYCIGDALGPEKIMLAHVATAEAEIAAANSMGAQEKMNYDVIPNCIFTSPEIGSVGLSEQQAIEKGYEVETYSSLYRNLGKAHASGEIAGNLEMICEKETKKLLGVHIIGSRTTDIIAEAALALKMKATAADLASTIHGHPTFAEIMVETAFKAMDRPLHG